MGPLVLRRCWEFWTDSGYCPSWPPDRSDPRTQTTARVSRSRARKRRKQEDPNGDEVNSTPTRSMPDHHLRIVRGEPGRVSLTRRSAAAVDSFAPTPSTTGQALRAFRFQRETPDPNGCLSCGGLGRQASMAAEERSNHEAEAPRERTIDRRVAVQQLEAALVEQARLGDDFQRFVGTSSEQASYARLRAASRRVTECDQAIKALSAGGRPIASGRE